MFRWSSNFLMVFGAIAFLPISSSRYAHCVPWAEACNDAYSVRECGSEEFCKKQSAACDAILILLEADDYYFHNATVKLRGMCYNRYRVYKNAEADTIKIPIPANNSEICSSVCNNVSIAQMFQKEEWCKKQGAACDTLSILQEADDYTFHDATVKLRDVCDNRFRAYKKPGTDTTEMPVTADISDDCICNDLKTVCNNMEAARLCKKLEFCADQATACASINYLLKGATATFGHILNDAMMACDNRYMAFKRYYPISFPRKIVNVKVEMDEF